MWANYAHILFLLNLMKIYQLIVGMYVRAVIPLKPIQSCFLIHISLLVLVIHNVWPRW